MDKEQINQVNQASQAISQTQELSARYVYCIGQFNGKQIDCTGIEGNPVRAVEVEELCAMVHDCKPEPYATKDPERAKKWIIEHENVVDKALQSMEAIIPFTFDTIFKEEGHLVEFLKLNREKIKEKLQQLKGKREFGIKIFFNESLRDDIAKIKAKQLEEIEKESKGKAYFLKKKIEREISAGLHDRLKGYFKEFYKKTSACGKILVEKTEEKNMLANFSCLVSIDEIEELSKILDNINNLQHFTVRFTGPWPPYSFASKLFEEENAHR